MRIRSLATAAALTALSAVAAHAADTTPEAQAHVAAAKRIAGDDLAIAQRIFCKTSKEMDELRNLGGFAKNYDMHYMEPVRVFDNVYAMGLTTVTVYAISTPDGIILIDAFYDDGIDSVLVPSLKKVGLDPARIKYIVVTHGHVDHYGGARRLQDRYGARVMMSAADWDFVEKSKAPPETKPKRDMVITEGQHFTFGGQSIDFSFIPGHTPGAVGLIFPVKEHGRPHMAAIFGGTQFGDMPVGQMQTYLHSIDHFANLTRKAGVDVELASHAIADDTIPKMIVLRDLPDIRPNPLVMTPASYQRFLQVHKECMAAAAPKAAGGG